LISAGQSFDELKTSGYTFAELQFKHKDGSISWISRNGAKLSDNRFILFISDITEKKKAENSLIEAKILAEHNNRIKSEFLANMSHELRTPLTAVIGFSDILQEGIAGELEEKQLGYVEHINNSGRHLLGIINDILDLSKIEAGKMELDCEDFYVSETIDETLKSMNLIARKKNIILNLTNNINNEIIFADKVKFQQILYNLLSNAIKFTPEDGKVFINLEKADNGIQVSVTDTGIGISAERQEEIFSPFTQVDASSKRRYGGTGLGLALVKKFVEMHNGKVWLESEEGEGSTFTFTIEDQKKNE
jgi:signal transduction histidine kinase